jgi:hypothetical protein
MNNIVPQPPLMMHPFPTEFAQKDDANKMTKSKVVNQSEYHSGYQRGNQREEDKSEKQRESKTKKKDDYCETFKRKSLDLYKILVKKFPTKSKIFIRKGKKPNQSNNTKNPEKRSQYIGVAKNGVKWQTLISFKKAKIFLGNYEDEIKASQVRIYLTSSFVLAFFGILKLFLNWKLTF